ncbi:MAG: NOP5/NOP56 family protein [Candidatus Hodarchaeota archaeon]
MKCILVTATGLLIGESDESSIIEKSAKIVDSIWFDQKDVLTSESLAEFIKTNSSRILGFLDQFDDEIISDNSQIIEYLRQEGFNNARYANMGELAPFRAQVFEYLKNNIQLASSDTIANFIRDRAMAKTRLLLREGVETRDAYIAQTINSIDDVNAILNLIYARLSEWYGIHFPELQELVRDNTQYIKLISKTKAAIRTDLNEEVLKHLSDKRRGNILEAAKLSLGSSISKFDANPISQLASFGVEILKIKDGLEAYIDESMKEVAPNIQCLVGSLLGARLISLAGSLENLAKSSSGTIQVLGAEKALFRHLRSGENPPKHGVIFQSPYIHSAKKHQRGKIARALAGKLSIATRVDFFSGEFIGPTLLQDLDKKVEEIKSSFPEPSERQLAEKRRKKKPKQKFPFKKGKFVSKGRKRGISEKKTKKRRKET